ncbi:hypothetical protein [Cellulomonas wangsupingiae]|uniref:hypothetical protein n=1 Tax=Cellulomonas wangsupingiae TaxID=2968085 RepID=UPI001D0E3209|nr:hypothetical protein [Cellulomonas wangsupingiae]MCM0639526.1 hypothetical protein [Cellulomonas wangsupingiae]
MLNFMCSQCADVRSFVSSEKLSCLIVGERQFSIDAYLNCAGCDAAIEAWFLVVSRDGLHAQAPTVRLERYVDNRRGVASRSVTGTREFDLLLERAQVAFEAGLGAGAMVYLRQAFELITKQVAHLAGMTVKERGSFAQLLKTVDENHHIIPRAFSKDGYRLFSELSVVVHGNSTEAIALQKFRPCEMLVRGVIANVFSDNDMRQAIDQLGWNRDEPYASAGDEKGA